MPGTVRWTSQDRVGERRVLVFDDAAALAEAAARDIATAMTATGAAPLYVDCNAIAADTSNEDSIKAMVQRAAQEMGHLDILVNGAARVGGSRPAPVLAEITEEDFWDDMKTKVLGYLTCAREVAPHMARQGWGRIINISGLAARQSGTIIGSMRNVSVAAMTKNLADQLGPQGINVTVVHPGLTRTERTAALVEAQMSSQGITAEEAEKRMASNISIGRMIDAEEIAYVITFLASPKSVAINGDAVAAAGGSGRAIHY